MSVDTVAILKTPNSSAQILRDGQQLSLDQANDFRWGDVVSNTSTTPMEIRIPARAPGQGDTLLVLQPQASAKLLESAAANRGEPSRTEVVAMTDGVELFDLDNDVASAFLTSEEGAASGLVGAGLLAAGGAAGPLGALAAVGLGALALSGDNGDEEIADAGTGTGAGTGGSSGTDGGTGGTGGGTGGTGGGTGGTGGGTGGTGGGTGGTGGGTGGTGGGTGTGGADLVTSGVVGGVNSLNDALADTPLEPATALTQPLADGLETLGGALSGANDPIGLGDVLAQVIGDPTALVPAQPDNGLVGLVNSVSTGLDNAFSAGQLAALSPVIDPLSQTLGSNQGVVDGVAQGLANVGSTLAGDTSPLAPLTSDVLAPIVGTSSGQDGGLPQTLNQAAEGLTDLTNPDSALAPLSALTEPLSGGVNTLADGVGMLGDAISQASTNDPSGLSALVGDLLGGTAPAAPIGSTSPLDSLPLPLNDLLP